MKANNMCNIDDKGAPQICIYRMRYGHGYGCKNPPPHPRCPYEIMASREGKPKEPDYDSILRIGEEGDEVLPVRGTPIFAELDEEENHLLKR